MIEEVRHKIEVSETIEVDDQTPSIRQSLEDIKGYENNFLSKTISASILRSRLPGVEEGDLNMAYYAKLGKMRSEQNTIFYLMNSEGNIVEGTEKISDVIYNFYENLYTKEFECKNTQNQFLKEVTVKLNEEERELLDKYFTIDELNDSMDGLTKEFDDYFWEFLCPLYMDCVKEIEESKSLTDSQKLGLIRISYKKMVEFILRAIDQ